MNKYIYIETDNVFESIKFDISGMKNKEIIATYSSGITSILDYNYLLNKFEKNSIEMEIKGFLAFLLQVFFNPIFLFQVRLIKININKRNILIIYIYINNRYIH